MLEHLHAVVPPASADPAQAHAGGEGFVQGGAVNQVVAAVPVFERGQRLLGVHQVAIGVVFDQHRAVLGAQLHQSRLV
ncbi:hypothetical protein D3C76_1696690 [compost metagenome]